VGILPGVSIGATLAAARRRSGMTVGEVSQHTRVTETIIRGIEQDDYAACGGDFYARGHIRAIARAVGEDPVPLIDEFDSTWRSAQELTAAEAFKPAMPIRKRERRRVRWTAFLAVLVLAVLGFAGYKFVAGASRTQHAAAGSHPSPGGPGSAPPASAPAVQGSSAQVSSAPATTAPPASASPIVVQALAPSSVAAFGPEGLANGDDPQGAALAIAGNPARPWISQWYATAEFGALKTGTGLLLDMGRTVTVASVRLSLVSRFGADIDLRAGSKPELAWLPRVASAADAGGTVRLQPGTPVQARYVLIWFTRLPPDNAGTYQASVYQMTVQGHRLPACTTLVWYVSPVPADYTAIDRINELLDSTDPETVNTSMRIPKALREAAALAVSELGVAPSTTALTASALRSMLQGTVMLAVLERHFEKYPELRPSLGDLAIAAAEMDGHPLAQQPELLRRSAAEVQRRHPDASPDDVLLWAEALQSAADQLGAA